MKTLKNLLATALLFSVGCFGALKANTGLDEKNSNIVDLTASAEFLSIFTAAVQAGDLVETLKGDGPYTIFVPTNDAFTALPEGVVDDLLKSENKEKLVQILKYHVIPGEVRSSDLEHGMKVKTIEGSKVMVHLYAEDIKINDASIRGADVMTANGIVHVIDRVMIPPME